MKRILKIYAVCLGASLIFAFLLNDRTLDYNFLTGLGLVNLVIGVLAFLVGLIAFAFDTELAKAILAASGLLLLTGTLTCSIHPFRMNAGL